MGFVKGMSDRNSHHINCQQRQRASNEGWVKRVRERRPTLLVSFAHLTAWVGDPPYTCRSFPSFSMVRKRLQLVIPPAEIIRSAGSLRLTPRLP